MDLSDEARYSDADLEPLRAALLALSNGDFRPRAEVARTGNGTSGGNGAGDTDALTRIWPLVDAVGAELSALNDEVARRAEQVRDIAMVITAVSKGDLTRKVTVEVQGEMLQLKQTVNTMVDQLSGFADEVTRVAREVGTEGRLGGQAHVRGVSGVWEDLTDSVNRMARNLTIQVRNISQVATAVASGDLSQKITVDAQGEVLGLKETLNTMVDQLSAFADEVTRVAREVGTEGRLGGQADVKGVSGIWKDLTDNVNSMARNLTSQVRNIAQVTTAVAQGDLSKKIDVAALGEILELKTTINTMVDTLSAFADEVTRVAREVGTEGRLGGQAEVEGVSGTWKRLTESVNGLASNLTTQVRAIAGVASAVAEGDLTPSITVEARGEVAELKDNINLMVANLRETTRKNREQDWLNTNLARRSQPHAGAPRPAGGGAADHERADAAGLGPVRRVLPGRPSGARAAAASSRGSPRTASTAAGRPAFAARRGPDRPGRAGPHPDPGGGRAARLRDRRLRPGRAGADRTWSCCRSCSRTRCSASSSWPRCTGSATCT